jgi:hypothetical protein
MVNGRINGDLVVAALAVALAPGWGSCLSLIFGRSDR